MLVLLFMGVCVSLLPCGVMCALWSAVGAQPSVVAALLLLVLSLCPECGGRATAVWGQGIL